MIHDTMRVRSCAARRAEGGFTLIEVLAATALLSIVLTLSVGALRHFWLVRSLSGSTEDVITQMRATQENAVSESYPVVYGVRFDVGERNWYVLRYDPVNAGAGDDTCIVTETYQLRAGVHIKAADFLDDPVITEFCRGATTAPTEAEFVFFYPRGNATSGNLTLEHSGIGETEIVDVSALTGRVEKR